MVILIISAVIGELLVMQEELSLWRFHQYSSGINMWMTEIHVLNDNICRAFITISIQFNININNNFNSIQFISIQFNSIQFNSIQFNSIQFNQFNLIQFNSIQFNSIQFNSIQFNSIQSISQSINQSMHPVNHRIGFNL